MKNRRLITTVSVMLFVLVVMIEALEGIVTNADEITGTFGVGR